MLESQLSASGIDAVSPGSLTEIAAAMRAELPDALIADLGGRAREAARLIEDTAQTFPAAQIPVVTLYETRALAERPTITLQLPRQRLPGDLGRRLRTIIAIHQNPDIHGQANPYALEIVAGVWRKGLSGQVIIDGTDINITLCDGGIIDPDQLPQLDQALTQRGVSFRQNSSFGLGDWYTVGQRLHNAARTRTTQGFLARNRKKLLKPRPNAARAEQLPLREATQALLDDRRTATTPLARRLSALEIPSAQVEQDLEVLWLLGLYRFQSPTSRTPRARTALQNLPPPSSRQSPRTAASSSRPRRGCRIPQEVRDQLELKRLRREVAALATADDWTVLSLQPTCDPDLVEAASGRMQERYVTLSSQASSAEVRSLAQQLTTRIEEATAAIRTLLAVYDAYGTPHVTDSREEVAFREGFSALQRRDLPRAHRLLTAAYDERMQSPRNLAYMAWATHLHKGASHSDDVLEYLQLSDSLTPEVPQTQLFLATVESERGDLERAELRLARLIKRGDATEEVHSLYRRVRQLRR
ncbi:MAG: hypothetical protein ACI8S6_001627 [Myxococcota bacterium]|jgi:hypothetical protein